MPKTYDDITAQHYAAFRPPLHALILDQCALAKEHGRQGLDIGCGTGRSTLALTTYCDVVIGIDPSSEMLKQAVPHPKIEYLQGTLEQLALPVNSFDIITFAGTLFYMEPRTVLEKIIPLGKAGSKIIVYDFNLDLSPALQVLDIAKTEKAEHAYNYETNFSEVLNEKVLPVAVSKNKHLLRLSSSDLTHLLLSEKSIYEKLDRKWDSEYLFKRTCNVLLEKNKSKKHTVEATTFRSVYELLKYD